MKKCKSDEDGYCPYFDWGTELSGMLLNEMVEKCEKCLGEEPQNDDSLCQQRLDDLMFYRDQILLLS